MTGVAISHTFLFFAYKENAYNPIKGPYVKVATLKMALTTDASLRALNRSITMSINIENATCTKCLFLTTWGSCSFSFLSKPKKSTQNEVVRAVSAESVVAKVAAVSPSIKTTAGIPLK